MGSLPSAMITACSARTLGLAICGTLAGIALYNPAKATTVSNSSRILFMGEVSFAHFFARRKYMPELDLLMPVDYFCLPRARRREVIKDELLAATAKSITGIPRAFCLFGALDRQ